MIELEQKNKQWLVNRVCAKLRLKGWSPATVLPHKVQDVLNVLREIHLEEEAKETYVPETSKPSRSIKHRKAEAQPAASQQGNLGVTAQDRIPKNERDCGL